MGTRGDPDGLTAELQERVVAQLVLVTLNDAARLLGMDARTLRRWRQRGRAYDERLQGGGTVKPAEERYRSFWQATDAARLTGKRNALVVVGRTLRSDDPRLAFDAAKFFLTHAYRDEYHTKVTADLPAEDDDDEIDEEAQRREALRLVDELTQRRRKKASNE